MKLLFYFSLFIAFFFGFVFAHPWDDLTDEKWCHHCWTNCDKYWLTYWEIHCHNKSCWIFSNAENIYKSCLDYSDNCKALVITNIINNNLLISWSSIFINEYKDKYISAEFLVKYMDILNCSNEAKYAVNLLQNLLNNWSRKNNITSLPIFDWSGNKLNNDDELKNAILWMYNNWLTKYWSIDKYSWANLLTREQFSKIIIQFLVTTWKQKENNSLKCNFKDMSQIDISLKDSVVKWCKYWLFLWVNGYFNPISNITKAQAIAVIVRTIYWVQDESWDLWYSKYVEKSNSLWIINWLQYNLSSLDNEYITRKDIAIIIYRLFNLLK